MVSELRADTIALSYRDVPVLREVSLALGRGETVGLIGPNGAGKTTLMRIMAGVQAADAGAVTLDGSALSEHPASRRARLLAYLPQGAPAHWPLLVERVVELGRIPHRGWWQALAAADREAIDRALAATDAGRLRDRIVTTLSGGERARVMLARVFATEPGFILADEPVASLDPFHQLQVMDTLRAHASDGGGVLVVLHDLNLAARYCDRLVALDRGQVVCEGKPREVLENPALAAAYSVRLDVVEEADGLWVRYR
jgi:iron complex transport system ATP-binding protein